MERKLEREIRMFNCDCLVGMTRLETGSVDLVLCDLPYGSTACAWDAGTVMTAILILFSVMNRFRLSMLLTVKLPTVVPIFSVDLSNIATILSP